MRSITQKEINSALQTMQRISDATQHELNVINKRVEYAVWRFIEARQYPFHIEVWPATNDVLYFGATIKVGPNPGESGWYDYVNVLMAMEPETYGAIEGLMANATSFIADLIADADFRPIYNALQSEFKQAQRSRSLVNAGEVALKEFRKTSKK